MSYDPSEGAAFAVRSAYLDLQNAISRIASEMSEEEIDVLLSEAEEFVAAMLAAVTLVDGRVRKKEAEFLCEMLEIKDMPGGAVRFVNQYWSKWQAVTATAPKFFLLAVAQDRDAAKELLRMIQLIGNNAAVSDAQFAASEYKIVRDCIASLEAAMFDKQ